MKITVVHRRAVRNNQSAYEEGLSAAIKGIGIEACPYKAGSEKRMAWIMGWLGA